MAKGINTSRLDCFCSFIWCFPNKHSSKFNKIYFLPLLPPFDHCNYILGSFALINYILVFIYYLAIFSNQSV